MVPPPPLSPADRERLDAIRAADGLADLVPLTGAPDEHAAYLDAKDEWYDLRGRELGEPTVTADAIPGARVDVDGHAFYVHGVTHADTAEEGAFLRERVSAALERGETVYCEQGVRPMYFADLDGACGMDDLRWAMERCRALDADSRVDDLVASPFEGTSETVESIADRFRQVVFDLVASGGSVYGERFERALGDVASYFLASHADLATGADFESFVRARRAARDPTALADLQRYYERAFLPQPLEREWLRRHDPELEIVTHARNERQADFAVYHNDAAETVHLVVGAAHQPGVRYYLERHRDGERDLSGFEPVG